MRSFPDENPVKTVAIEETAYCGDYLADVSGWTVRRVGKGSLLSCQEGIALVTPQPGGGTLIGPYEGVASAFEVLGIVCAMRLAAPHISTSRADSQVLSYTALFTLGLH